jgi:hypothetical protein
MPGEHLMLTATEGNPSAVYLQQHMHASCCTCCAARQGPGAFHGRDV